MNAQLERHALILSANDFLEHEYTLYNKWIFLGEIASTIDRLPHWDATILDITATRMPFSRIVEVLLTHPDVVLVHAEVSQAPISRRLANLVRAVSPMSRILVYGLATKFIPQYFLRAPFDAVHISGDREAAVAQYLLYIEGVLSSNKPAGVSLIDETGHSSNESPGIWLDSSDWPEPSLSKLPIDAYFRLSSERRLEHAITATKGCPFKCSFCGCTEEEGFAHRLRDPGQIVEWAMSATRQLSIPVHLYSPNILLSKSWVRSFCEEYHRRNTTFVWHGVTRTDTLTEEIVELVASSGCRKLAVGVEHVSSENGHPLKSSSAKLENAAKYCLKHEVTLFGLVMLGYPGQTVDDVRYCLSIFERFGITRYRFTGFTPLHALRDLSVEELDLTNLEEFDRRTFYRETESKLSRQDFYQILMSNGACLKAP